MLLSNLLHLPFRLSGFGTFILIDIFVASALYIQGFFFFCNAWFMILTLLASLRRALFPGRITVSHNLLDNSLDFPPSTLTDITARLHAGQQVVEHGEAHSCLGIASFQKNCAACPLLMYNNYSTSYLCMP